MELPLPYEDVAEAESSNSLSTGDELDPLDDTANTIEPLLSMAEVVIMKENLVNSAKNALEEVTIALAIIGSGTTAEIAKTIVKYKLGPIIPRIRVNSLRNGRVTGTIGGDSRLRSVLRHGNSTSRVRPLEMQLFMTLENRKQKAFCLRTAGTAKARHILGLDADASIPVGSLTAEASFDHILNEPRVWTFEEILSKFAEDHYGLAYSCWTNPGQFSTKHAKNPIPGILGRYLKERTIRVTCTDRDVLSYRNFYWLAKFGVEPLFAKLGQPYRDLLVRGMTFYQPLIEYRIMHRRKKDVSNNKLLVKKRFPGTFDTSLDLMSLAVPIERESEFFKIAPSTIEGAGDGAFALVDMPPGTIVFIHGGTVALRNPSDQSLKTHGFSAQHPTTGEMWETDTLVDGKPSCIGAYFNDSRDNEQQFEIQCFDYRDASGQDQFDVFLVTRVQIKAGEEVFLGYGDDYWITAQQAGIRGSSKYRGTKRKTRSGDSKREKLSDLFPLPEPILQSSPSSCSSYSEIPIRSVIPLYCLSE